jgi:hypothetical protein
VTGAVYVVKHWDSKSVTVQLHENYRFKKIEELKPLEEEVDNEPASDDEEFEDVPVADCSTTDNITYKLSLKKAGQILRLQFALCYASIQGRTFRDKHIGLMRYNGTLVNMRDIITATSRPTHSSFLHFINTEDTNQIFYAASRFNDADLQRECERIQ